MAIQELWVEKYRPNTLDGYVFKDEAQREQIQSWVNSKAIPHLLFSGSAGIGKTTLAKILINALEVDEYDLLQINASRERGIDIIRDNIKSFSQTMPFGHLKVILLDEADHLTQDAQASLRGAIGEYSQTVRFILTCNYPNKIIPALHSRCQGFHIEKVDHTEFTARVATVLVNEGIEFDLDTLDSFVTTTYPDLRKCLNMVQMHSVTGSLTKTANGASGTTTSDYRLASVELFKKGKIREARELICKQIRPEDVDELIRWAYDNLQLWSQTPEGQDEAILIIRKALVNSTLVADAEINMSAMFVELSQLGK